MLFKIMFRVNKMKSFQIVCSAFVLLAHSCFCQFDFPAPINFRANPRTTAVGLAWREVENATSYEVVLVDTNQTVTTDENRAAFGGLTPLTGYLATVRALGNGTAGEIAALSFSTVLGKVANLRFVEATAATMDIAWDASRFAVGYEVTVRLSDTNENVTSAEIFIEGTTAFIVGLEPRTYYRFIVRGVTDKGRGANTAIRARTDGSGVTTPEYWQGVNGFLGGKAEIFRPLEIPHGPYTIRLDIPCPPTRIKIWNARVNRDLTRPEDGFYVLVQDRPWMRRKTEIGFVFHYINGTAGLCDFGEANITADFGDDVVPQEVSTFTELPFQTREWLTSTLEFVESAGLIQFLLQDIFANPNTGGPATDVILPEKPPVGEFVFMLDTGEGCAGGIIPQNTWGMRFKDTSDVSNENANRPNILFFAQDLDTWHTNEPGLVYGYDPAECLDRSGITAQVLQNSSFVDQVFEAPDIK